MQVLLAHSSFPKGLWRNGVHALTNGSLSCCLSKGDSCGMSGIIPPFTNPELRGAFAAWGGSAVLGGGMQARLQAPPPQEVWMPPVRRVHISEYAERTMRSALIATAHMASSNDDDTGRANGAPAGHRHAHASGDRSSRPSQRGPRPMPPPPRALVGGGPLGSTREQLPVYGHRLELLDALSHPVSIVEGETGSGKTTQVAQYLLEEAAASGRPVNIICTQPRRISAIGVADRVAAERGERVGEMGCAVGYAVRGESRQCSDTSLLFCTTGVLLRMLEEDPELKNVTHVMVDEVHERTVENDFLLLTLKSLLKQQADRRTLHVCLMSATMDSQVLESYFAAKEFGPVPRIKVGGRTFPVTQLHLEDALSITGHQVDTGADWCRHSQAAQRRQMRKENSRPEGQPAERAPSESDFMLRFPRHHTSVCRALAALDPDALNVALVCELVMWFRRCGSLSKALHAVGASDGKADAWVHDNNDNKGEAVLVFLPGTKEIEDVKEALMRTELGRDYQQRDWVLPLHGALPSEDQKKVFLRPPSGVVKVVLATNVAETSITIDDVGFVIDSGRVKEERYEAARRMASLEDVLVSRAAAKQRRGRAGRVQPGLCVHLYPSDVEQAAYTEPEVRRVALEQLVMRTKALRLRGLGGTRAADICSRLPEPPDIEAVNVAVMELTCLGALTPQEELTELGKLLAKLPVDARLGKLILLGVCFGATDESLTIAAALASRSPFMSPMERREQADESRRSFGMGLQSDHLAVMLAYQEFDKREHSRFDFARDRFLSIRTLQSIGQLKRQLLEALSQAGMCPSGLRASYVESLGRHAGGCDGVRIALHQRGVAPPELLFGILCAALFPQVAYIHAPLSKKGSCGADMVRLHVRDPKGNSFEPQVAYLHPSSINSKTNGGPQYPPRRLFARPFALSSSLPCANSVCACTHEWSCWRVCAACWRVCAVRSMAMAAARESHATVSCVSSNSVASPKGHCHTHA